MLIVCPTCATAYQIQLAALGGAGRSVRCSHCRNTWFATADSVVEEAAILSGSGPAAAEPPPEDFISHITGDVIPPPDTVTPLVDNPFTVANAPPLVPQDQPEAEAEPTPKFDPGVPDHVETIAARRIRQSYADRKDQRSLLRRLASLPMLIVMLSAILAGALNWRAAVVRHFPQTASLYAAIGMKVNLRGLTFANIKTTTETQDGVPVLVVEGQIVAEGRQLVEVPRLRLALRNSLGHEVYAWTALPTKTTLGSGNGLPFRARLASPPPDGRDVIVRFFNRRDAGSP